MTSRVDLGIGLIMVTWKVTHMLNGCLPVYSESAITITHIMCYSNLSLNVGIHSLKWNWMF